MYPHLVTVGLPVRNGASLLDEAIAALHHQTHKPLRILISDNCSTDATPAICRAWAERDPRIEYVRQPEALSVVENFRFVFEQCSSPYFMWAAHDDLRSENYVAALVEALEAQPKASVAFGDLVNFTDVERLPDEPVVHYEFENAGLAYRQRAAQVLRSGCGELYGVIRAERLRGYGWYGIDFAADAPISTYLALRGDFIHVPSAVFYQWVAPEPKTARQRAKEDSYRSLGPFRWVRLSWVCASSAVAAELASGRKRSRTAAFAYLYLRVRPTKLPAELFAATPPAGRRLFGAIKRPWRSRRALAQTSGAHERSG